MLLPSSVSYSMRVPSLFFRIKATGKCREVGQPHPDGVHLQLDGELRWYTLDELEPITENDFEAWKASFRKVTT